MSEGKWRKAGPIRRRAADHHRIHLLHRWTTLTKLALALLTITTSEHVAAQTRTARSPSPATKPPTSCGPGHFGMIFLPGAYRRTKADTGRIIAALEARLARYPGKNDLANGEDWL